MKLSRFGQLLFRIHFILAVSDDSRNIWINVGGGGHEILTEVGVRLIWGNPRWGIEQLSTIFYAILYNRIFYYIILYY